jgi:hypothetical protein
MSRATKPPHDQSHVNATAGVSISPCGHVRTIFYDAAAGDWVSGINHCQCAFCKGLRDKAPCNASDCHREERLCAACGDDGWRDWPPSVEVAP